VTSTSTQIDNVFVTSTATSVVENFITSISIIDDLVTSTTVIENFVTSTSVIDNFVTSTVDVQVQVTSTIYSTAPECSVVAALSNSDFSSPLTDNAWDETIASGVGFDISTDTSFVNSGNSGLNSV
jgi:hypothetical protein